jgi:RNA polymerase sigma-70 factor (ECF subfamily)
MHGGESRYKPFPTTKWTLIARVSGGSAEERESALAEICELYRPPIYAFIRNLGHTSHDAEDLTQEFFSQFLSRNSFERTDSELGKLRSYLRASVTLFLRGQHRKRNSQKRGGGVPIISMESASGGGLHPIFSVANECGPDTLFDRHWAETLLENVMVRLEGSCRESGEIQLFDQLVPFLRVDTNVPAQVEVAKALGISEGALRVRLHRFRARYRQILQAEVAATLAPGDDIASEIAYLRSLFV